MQAQTYYLASIISISVGFLLTIVSIWFLYRQIIVARRNRELELIVKLYEVSSKDPLFSDFEVVWSISSPKTLSNEEQDSAIRVCLFFEMVGSIATQRYVDTTLIEEYFGSLVVECYDALYHYIDQQRNKPYNNKFAINFERLKMLLEQSKRVSRIPGHHETTIREKIFKTLRGKKPF